MREISGANQVTIGQTIAKLRKENGLTQEQLAQKLYVSRQAVSKWETGSAQPDLDNIRALSEYFGVSTDLFLNPSLTDHQEIAEEKTEWIDDQETLQEETPDPMDAIIEDQPNHGFWKNILLCVVFELLLLGCAAMPFGLAHFHLVFSYGWLLPSVASLLTVLGVILLSILRKNKHGILTMAVFLLTGLVISGWLWFGFYQEKEEYNRYLVSSPNQQETFLLKQNVTTGDTVYFRERFWLLMQEKEMIPNAIQGTPKFQWMTEDVCTITYEGKNDGAMHEYVATFGDRNAGSYYYVVSALYGTWSGKQEGTENWKISADSGISLKVGNQLEETYSFEDCVQFGTTAIVLCRGGLPRWTIALNTDCTLSSGSDLIAPGGTITLTQVSMNPTPNYIFSCDTDLQKQEDIHNSTILTPSQEQIDQESVSAMNRLASEILVTEELLPDGVKLLTNSTGNIPWMIFLNMIEPDDTVKGGNGVDRWFQLKDVQLIAGDESNGCWKISIKQECVSPGNQGAEPTAETAESSHYVRLVQTAGGEYLYYISNYDLSFELPEVQKEKIDLSQNDAYHRFEPADYSGENWQYMNVTRLSPEEAARWLYEKEFAQEYPNATYLSENARAGYLLEEGCYLLYDGIWQENGRWVYRFWNYRTSKENIEQWNGQVETIGFFDVDFYAYEK